MNVLRSLRLRLIVTVAALAPAGVGLTAVVRAEAPDSGFRSASRVVHHFDFDERRKGNLENIPKFWGRFRPPGFPHYTRGEFDLAVGGLAPPSFRLVSEGRSVAYHYAGPETPVRAA